MSPPVYQIGLVALEGDGRVAEFKACVQALAAQALGDEKFAKVDVVPAADVSLDGPSVTVILWADGLTDVHLAPLATLITADITVIPVVGSLDAMPDLPEGLAALNALGWDRGPTLIARTCLRELGVFERARSVFISHRRSDGMLAAERLYEALTKAGWRVFVDRFGIDAGAGFRERIEEALEECAFVLLLETPQASTSDGVLHEVLYALEHTLGITIANIGDAPPFPGAGGIRRTAIEQPFSTNGSHIVLSDEAVAAIVELVESEHAAALVRRRRQLLVSTMAAARCAGLEAHPVPGWRLRVTAPDQQVVVVGVVPHLPVPIDLYDLGQATGGGSTAVLVHSAHTLGGSRTDLLRWIIGERPIELVPNNAIGARWVAPNE